MSKSHYDIIIVGAGLAGICAAYHIQTKCTNKSYAVLEGRDDVGGTWDFFKYPGIRSDSDMATLGYSFRPWTEEQQIADGPSLKKYIEETAREEDIYKRIQFNTYVDKANWSKKEHTWSLDLRDPNSGELRSMTCNVLLMCSGYYNYKEGYTPNFKGKEDYEGTFVHPQHWPEDLDYQGKKVVVIGSGATAVTIVPAMAEGGAEQVTMLQRSPSYFVNLPKEDKVGNLAYKTLPTKWAYKMVKWKNFLVSDMIYRLAKSKPEFTRNLFMKGVKRELPADFDVEKHFTPTYKPWDQRLCIVPDGDFFQAIRKRRAFIETDHIDHFTPKGIKLQSGKELEADIIISATGLKLQAFGGMSLQIEGEEVDLAETFIYKGVLISGVPNMGAVVGYTNATWTLKADLSSAYFCRLINHMDKHGHKQFVPETDDSLQGRPLLSNLNSGYINRSLDQFPMQGPTNPWLVNQSYVKDIRVLMYTKLEDGDLQFS